MDGESVNACAAIEEDIRHHLTAALSSWDEYVRLYRFDDPGTAFDLIGDPPAWVREVRGFLERRKP